MTQNDQDCKKSNIAEMTSRSLMFYFGIIHYYNKSFLVDRESCSGMFFSLVNRLLGCLQEEGHTRDSLEILSKLRKGQMSLSCRPNGTHVNRLVQMLQRSGCQAETSQCVLSIQEDNHWAGWCILIGQKVSPLTNSI